MIANNKAATPFRGVPKSKILPFAGVFLWLLMIFAGGQAFAAAPEPSLELFTTHRAKNMWVDFGSGAKFNAAFYRASYPAGQGFAEIATFGTAHYSAPYGMVVAKQLVSGALAHPVDFTMIWADSGSGADRDGSFWRPVPPPGYVSLGDVAQTGYSKPVLTDFYCVHNSLVVEGKASGGGQFLWNDRESGADNDFSAFFIQPKDPSVAISVGGFVGMQGHYDDNKPENRPSEAVTGKVWCLKANAVKAVAAPTSLSHAYDLISSFAPELRMHQDEQFLPDDPAPILSHPGTVLRWGITANKSDNEDGFNNFTFTQLGSTPTSERTLRDDVQKALSHPRASEANFTYYLDYSLDLVGGDMGRARAYVRIQPKDGVFTDIQYWIFYPWNGPGKFRVSAGDLEKNFYVGTVGRHYSDWESISVRVSNKNVWWPGQYWADNISISRHSFEGVMSVHDSSMRYQNGRPIVYSARDSHAMYFSSGEHFYERVASESFGLGTFAIDLRDITSNSANVLQLFQPGRSILVSSAWPSLNPEPPAWFYFAGQWGGYEKLKYAIGSVFGYDISPQYEIGNGKPGLIQRGIWDVAERSNANLGSLLVAAGALQPAFNPQQLNYTLSVDNGVDSIRITPQAVDHKAKLEYRVNDSAWKILPGGKLLGAQTDPIPLGAGVANLIQIRLTTAAEFPTVKTYTIDVDRASYTVANLNDSGPGSLRQGIAQSGNGETLSIPREFDGQVLVLNGSPLTISKTLRIDASDLPNGLTISGAGRSRIFFVSSQGSLNLANLTLRDGNAGTGNGGAIVNQGRLTLSGCRVRNNVAAFGGGIAHELGEFYSFRTEITANKATQEGGGVIALASGAQDLMEYYYSSISQNEAQFGGGLSSYGGKTLLSNSTIGANTTTSATAGVYCEGGEFLAEFSTIADSGIIALGAAKLTLANSIVTKVSGGFHAEGGNLVETHTGVVLSGNAPIIAPAKLGPFGNYGGPTSGFMPRGDSPAVDAATGSSLVEFDQRRVRRGQKPDLGAIETPELFLQSLALSDGELGAPFSQGTRDFAATVPSDTDVLFLIAGVSIPEAEARAGLNGGALQPISDGLALRPAGNTITISLSLYNGVFEKTYTVQATRLPPRSDANLFSLATSAAALDKLFDPAVKQYNAGVVRRPELKLWTHTSDPAAKLEVRANNGSYKLVPRQMPIAAGPFHSLIVDPSGKVVGEGMNYAGQIQIPAGLAGESFSAVAAGSAHSLALGLDRSVSGWGNNEQGESSAPQSLRRVVAIAAGAAHSLALNRDGKVFAWGSDGSAQSTVPVDLVDVVAIAAGSTHSMALRRDGTISIWGSGRGVQMPAGLTGVVAIAAGEEHSLALTRDGKVTQWGWVFGDVPADLAGVVAIAAGSGTSYAVRGDGTVAAWGLLPDCEFTAFVANLSDVATIAAGTAQKMVVQSDGTLISFGRASANRVLPEGVRGATDWLPSLPLQLGSNTIELKVTAEDGTEKVYTIAATYDDSVLVTDYPPAPESLDEVMDDARKRIYRNITLIGHTVYYHVVGEPEGEFGANVSGTGTYNLRSNLGQTAVHAGILGVGEEGIVALTLVRALNQYTGSTQNGMTSRGSDFSQNPDPPTAFNIAPFTGDPFAKLRKRYNVQAQVTPADLRCYFNAVGQTFHFLVRGSAPANPSSPASPQVIWYQARNDRYPHDSAIATAAVHAGILKDGETGVVAATIDTSFSFSKFDLDTDTALRNGVKPNKRGDNHSSFVSGSYRLAAVAVLDEELEPVLGTDATLASLAVDSATLAPAFSPGVTSYQANPGTVFLDFAEIQAAATDPKASVAITVNSIPLGLGASASATELIPLRPGANTVEVTVTAEDRTTKSTYTVALQRAGQANSTLATLAFFDTSVSLPFSPNVTSYNVSVPIEKSIARLVFSATDVSAKTDIRLNDGPFLATTAGISSRLLLREGANTIEIRVTADGGASSTTYAINAARGVIQPPDDLVVSLGQTAGGFILRVEGAATYSVDYTADLSLPWTEIARDVTGPFTETDAGRTANRTGFYRARIGGN